MFIYSLHMVCLCVYLMVNRVFSAAKALPSLVPRLCFPAWREPGDKAKAWLEFF